MIPTDVKRPRNVDGPRAAAILYGDWGTSKAYVIGLAFAVAGYASFWLIAAMCVLTALVGLNYMVICRLYPDGGGVYASVRHRSEVISIVGAFLLIADYLVTRPSARFPPLHISACRIPKNSPPRILIIGLLNSARTKTNWRSRLSDFSADRDRRRRARAFQSAALGEAIRTFTTTAWRLLAKLGRLRRHRARAFRCGSR
jgi:hypothetical protein